MGSTPEEFIEKHILSSDQSESDKEPSEIKWLRQFSDVSDIKINVRMIDADK